jgi:hypothetical protein
MGPPPRAEFEATGPETEPDGILRYRVKSPYQAGEVLVRFLVPAKLEPAASRRVVFVLPVEPGLGTRFGDGLEAVRRLDAHSRFGFLAVAPTFSDWPGYADHPTDPALRQESHLLRVVIPLVARLYPHEPRRRGLLGFSKAGWGAFALLLRHPEAFGAAVAWDAPLMADGFVFEMGRVVGTRENFEHYRVSRLLADHAEAVRGSKRLGLFGYNLFRGHLQGAHALMEKLGIPHAYADGPRRPHRWESGWLEGALESLLGMLPPSGR